MKHTLQLACLWLGLLLLSEMPVYAQEAGHTILKGNITDQHAKPPGYLTVLLFTASDTLQPAATYPTETGAYTFKVQPGNYYLKVLGLSYKPYRSKKLSITGTETEIILPLIKLEQQANALKEVTVNGMQQTYELTDGKLVYNLEKNPAAAGASALDLLQRTPGVSLDQNENILLKGAASVNVLIDGKMTYVSADRLSMMLKGMNSANISRIEVIQNPTAEFDAAGNAGIINIITKKRSEKGYAADIHVGVGAGRYFLNRESITGNIRTGKFNFYGTLGHDNRHAFALRSGSQDKNTGSDQMVYTRAINDETQTHYYTYQAGVDFYPAKNMDLGFVYNGYTDNWSRDAEGVTLVTGEGGRRLATVQNRNVETEPYYNNTFNLSYKLKFDTTGTALTTNADYVLYRNNSDGFIGNRQQDAETGNLHPYQQLNYHQPSNIAIWSFKTDLDLPLKPFNLKAGLKYADVKINNDFKYDSLRNETYVFAPSLSDHFIYKEQIGAAYVSAEKKWQHTSINAGLRLEHTRTDANSVSTNNRKVRQYTNLFPSLTLSRQLGEAHKLTLSLSRRINRPVYSNLNPVRYFADKYAYFEGNPNLKPEKAWVTSVSYSLQDKHMATFSYNRSVNFIAQRAYLDNTTGILVTTNANYVKRDRFDLMLVSPLKLHTAWNSTQTVNLSYTSYPLQDPEGIRAISNAAVDIISNQSIALPGSLMLEIVARYTSPTLNGAYMIRPFFSVDGGLRKTFLDKKLDARLSFSDVLGTVRYEGYTITKAANSHYSINPDSRRINLSLTYHVGGKLVKSKARRIEELDRL